MAGRQRDGRRLRQPVDQLGLFGQRRLSSASQTAAHVGKRLERQRLGLRGRHTELRLLDPVRLHPRRGSGSGWSSTGSASATSSGSAGSSYSGSSPYSASGGDGLDGNSATILGTASASGSNLLARLYANGQAPDPRPVGRADGHGLRLGQFQRGLVLRRAAAATRLRIAVRGPPACRAWTGLGRKGKAKAP